MSDPAEYQVQSHLGRRGRSDLRAHRRGRPLPNGPAVPVLPGAPRDVPRSARRQRAGASATASASRRAARRSRRAATRDVRDGLPIGMHLTDDPNTHVPFSFTAARSATPRSCGGRAARSWSSASATGESASTRSTTRSPRSRRGPDFDKERIATRRAQDRRTSAASPGRPSGATPSWAQTIRALKERASPRARAARTGARGPARPGRDNRVVRGWPSGSCCTATSRPRKTVGWARIPDAIGFGQKRTLSWDGGSEGPSDAIVIDADIAAGARIEWYVKHPLAGAGVAAYLRHLPRDLRFPAAHRRGPRRARARPCSRRPAPGATAPTRTTAARRATSRRSFPSTTSTPTRPGRSR